MTTTNSPATRAPSPELILQTGLGFWASKTLLSAVELELFTQLSEKSLTASEIADRLDLHPRSQYDFLDALVSLGLLDRDGNGPDARYQNTPDAAIFLDKTSPAYLGGILEMSSARLFGFWGSLTEAFRTGEPQNEIKAGAPDCSKPSTPTQPGWKASYTACTAFSSAPSLLCARRWISALTQASATSAGLTAGSRPWSPPPTRT